VGAREPAVEWQRMLSGIFRSGSRIGGEETQATIQELVRKIQDKSIQLADLYVILEDYQRERRELLHEIGELKAALWELSAEAGLPPRLPGIKPAGDQPSA
jgi:uncharacterized coiled-coil DUF342 family protein